MKAVIFDMDGTIVNTENAKRKDMDSKSFKSIIPTWTDQDNQNLVGKGILFIYDYLKTHHNYKGTFEELYQYCLEYSKELYSQGVELMPGVIEFVKHLNEQKIPVAIATSNHSQNIEIIFKQLNLYPYFPFYVSEDHVNNIGKPEPDVYLKAAEKLGVNPKDIIAIEDSSNGIKSALSAGMICLAYTQNGHNTQDLSLAHDRFDCFTELNSEELQKKYFQFKN